LKRYGHESLQEKKIAEIGCGTGYWLREFIYSTLKPFGLALESMRLDDAADPQDGFPQRSSAG
jgi:hypothetical protein